jgi:hypothetical protein
MLSTRDDDLRSLSDDDLAVRFATAGEDARAALLAEAARRDRRDAQSRRDRQWWKETEEEWILMTHAHFLAAEAECRGNLLSREGIAAGVSDWPGLWQGPASRAMRYASEELREFWETTPRMTISQFAYQAARPRQGCRR